jgi:allantoicase
VNIQTQRLSLSLACIESGAVIDVVESSATFGDVDNLVDPSRRHFAVGALTFWELM